ncbi:MAG TPA: ATP-binding protein [Roseomonas sp.]|jgi:hypothetical protein
MTDPWFPRGFAIPDAGTLERQAAEGDGWQIYDLAGGGRALFAAAALHDGWLAAGLLAPGQMRGIAAAGQPLVWLRSGFDHSLAPVAAPERPTGKGRAMAFAAAFAATRAIAPAPPLGRAIYVEAISRLLPVAEPGQDLPDDVVLGRWLSGGLSVSAPRLGDLAGGLRWGDRADLLAVIQAAGGVAVPTGEGGAATPPGWAGQAGQPDKPFRLPGRPALEAFFTEHVIDIVQNAERYKRLGVGFPGSIVLHGPPGSGKSFAVKQLAAYLGWPRFDIDASSVGSPFIHEMSRKVADAFRRAAEVAPAVLVIDEMDAFLSDRGTAGNAQHRVEEVAEFLRRIPEATENRVLLIGMTNKLDLIDAAVLRRGRFDHVVPVGEATPAEIAAALAALLEDVPRAPEIDLAAIAARLAGKPLSDAAFVAREAARLAARGGRDALAQADLLAALDSPAIRGDEDRPIFGFDLSGGTRRD